MSLMSERIYERRKELGLTMEELGEKVGVSKSTVNKWEKGQIENIKRPTISKLATVLECDPVWLMGISGSSANVRDYFAGVEKRPLKDKSNQYYPISINDFCTAYRKKGCDMMDFLDAVDMDYDVLSELLEGKSHVVNKKTLSQISIYLNVPEYQLINYKISAVSENEQYIRIIKELETIKGRLGATYSDEELSIINAYRSADELTQAMVRRTLSID